MRTTMTITAVAGLAVAVGIGAIIATGSDPDADLQPVAADIDTAPQPERISAASPASRAPVGTVIKPESIDAQDRPQPEQAGDDRPGPGQGWNRDRRGGQRMDPTEFAERFQSRRDRMKEMMDRYDTDGDGELSDAEREVLREAMRERWRERMLERMTERFDADGDGILSEDERLEAEAEMEARRLEWQVRMTERFDTDGDGKLSDAEQQAARNQFRRGPGMDEQTVQRYDRDGDGELNLDESYAAYLDRFDARERDRFVRQYDAAADGSVDAADLESFLTRYREADPQTDVNGDGIINQLDVDRFRDLMMTQGEASPLPPRGPRGFGDFGGARDGARRGSQRDSAPADSADSTDND